MSKADQIAAFSTPGTASSPGQDPALVELPPLPEDVKKRFPSMIEWEEKLKKAWKKTNVQNAGSPIDA